MDRLTKVNDHELLSNEPLFSKMIEKLKCYENAEEEGYIHRCNKCNSLNICVESGTFDEGGGYMNHYTEYTCNDCNHVW